MSRLVLPAAVVVCCLAYAVVRYNVFGGVAPDQLPVCIANKAFSFAGLILLGWSRCSSNSVRRRELGITGLSLTFAHVVLSLVILKPAYFGKFFHPSGLMTWQAELSMLAGALGFLAMCWLFFRSKNAKEQPEGANRGSLQHLLGRGVLVLAAVHVAAMGYAGWFTPDMWCGYMPPITLLSFLIAVIATAWRRQGT
jgi:hypothetical protein